MSFPYRHPFPRFQCRFPFFIRSRVEPNSIAHTGRDEHAVDFLVPEGTFVCAPRDGVVIFVKDDSDRGGSDRLYENDANYIVIKHNLDYVEMGDSHEEFKTIHWPEEQTIIVHLAKGSVRVKVGDRVRAGQIIARQGSTGWTFEPHIHFAVYRYGVSIPLQFGFW